MVGRHFLVYSKNLIQVKRQYTICCAIVPNIYKELLRICSAGKSESLDVSLLSSNDQESVFLTCKDYKTKNGVASQLHNQSLEKDQANDWFVKGPMGMGLGLNPNGHNIVFTGGTGILVFLDVLAMMIL